MCGEVRHSFTMNKTETLISFSDKERLARLRLIRTDGIGPVLFRQLIMRFGSGVTAAEQAPELAASSGRRKPLRIADARDCARELEAVNRLDAQAFFWGESAYPYRLAATEDAPPVLYTLGNTDLLSPTSTLGVVGARNASASGIKLTGMLAGKVSDAGTVIVSGLARGIDAAAHKASLSATVACVAGGLDVIYPRENTELYHKLTSDGLVVSEMPPGTQPQARHFPRRNRIISGLSDGVLIVEAALRSGSLITARCALEQGRDVFAVPGSPLDPRSQGANKLLKDGAILVGNADDILNELSTWHQGKQPILQADFDFTPREIITTSERIRTTTETSEGTLLSLLSPSAVHIDDVIRLSGLPTEAVLSGFLELELAGKITRHAGGKVSLS